MNDFSGFQAARIFDEISSSIIVFNESEIVFSNAIAKLTFGPASWNDIFYPEDLQTQLSLFFQNGKIEAVPSLRLNHTEGNEKRIYKWAFKDLSASDDHKTCLAIGESDGIVTGELSSFQGAADGTTVFKNDPGHVLINFGSWTVETSVLVLVLGLIILWFVVQVLMWFWRAPVVAARRMREQRAFKQLEKGLLALTEGDWSAAEKALEKSATVQGKNTAHYLAAAQASVRQSDLQRLHVN